MSPSPPHVCDHFIPVGKGKLFARAWRPDGADPNVPAILMFHDSLGSVELWRDFPAALVAATGLPVVAYDRLGFGRSSAHPALLCRDFVEAEGRLVIPALRRVVGLDRFIAFGHSVGGGMAVAAASAFPDACAGVVTLAAQSFIEDRTLAGIRAAQAQFDDPPQVARLSRYHGDKARWVLAAWIETWLAPDFADWTLDGVLRQARAPLLAMHGDQDEFGSFAHLDRIAAKAGGSVAAMRLSACGHVPHREKPREVLSLVAGFIRRHVAKTI